MSFSRKYWKGIVLRLSLFVVWGMLVSWTMTNMEISEEQTKKSNREVVMLDAWSYFSGKNSREKYEGFFRDKETGETFTYPVSGYLHHIYMKDKKSIDMKFPLSPKDIGLVNEKIDREFLSVISVIVSLIWAVMFVAFGIVDWWHKQGFTYRMYLDWKEEK